MLNDFQGINCYNEKQTKTILILDYHYDDTKAKQQLKKKNKEKMLS